MVQNTHIFSHLATPQHACCRPHLEQHSGHRGGSGSTEAVVGSAGIFSQGILIPQGNDEGAFWVLGPARELEGRGNDK